MLLNHIKPPSPQTSAFLMQTGRGHLKYTTTARRHLSVTYARDTEPVPFSRIPAPC